MQKWQKPVGFLPENQRTKALYQGTLIDSKYKVTGESECDNFSSLVSIFMHHWLDALWICDKLKLNEEKRCTEQRRSIKIFMKKKAEKKFFEICVKEKSSSTLSSTSTKAIKHN